MPTSSSTRDWLTSDFDFDLPPENIAQTPIEPRDQARLLHVTPNALTNRQVRDLPDILHAGDLLVLNDTKVIPARLFGTRGDVKAEILLHQRKSAGVWTTFARPGKRLRVGDMVVFAPDFQAEIIAKYDNGQIDVRFAVPEQDVMNLLHRYGEPPLPPYIKRAAGQAKQDKARYQTVYAHHEGAVAAPTAGLHFTPELLHRLKEKHDIAHVTLHVGAGTFLPVKAEHIKNHIMHSEWGEVSESTAALINKAKSQGRRIVAVGTTSLRLLESAADESGVVHPFAQSTDIFITPGYRFKIVNALMTNFHLPQSTLFMLVCAFAGYERMRQSYAYAIKQNYRFYSYGDASFLEKQ